MRYLIPLRHGKGVLSLVTVIFLSLLVLFLVPYLSFEGKPLLPSIAIRLSLTVILLLLWILYYLVRYSFLAAATDEQLQVLRGSGQQRKRRKLERRQLDRWLNKLRGKGFWRGGGRTSSPPWFLTLSNGWEGVTPVVQQMWPVLPGPVASEGRLQAFQSLEAQVLHANVAADTGAAGNVGYWRLLAQRCSRARKGVPFQGVVCILRIADIQDQAVLQQFSQALQAVLIDAQGRLPVYLVISDVDDMAGFEAFAAALTPPEQQQLFGVNLPLGGEGPRGVLITESLADLQKRLEAMLTRALHQERQLEQRKELVRFPTQFDVFCNRLGDALNFCLPTSSHLVVRAIHFIGARRDRDGRSSSSLPAIPGDVPNAWLFVQRWWQDFLQLEKGLAIPGTHWLRRQWLKRFFMGTALASMFVVIAFWQMQSFRSGQQQLDELQQALSRHASSEEPGSAESPRAVLSMVRLWTDAMEQFSISGNFTHWPGLSLTSRMDDSLADFRARLHRDSVLPLVRRQAESVLRGSSDNPESLMSALKIYLMLADPNQRDEPMIAQWYREQVSADLSVKGIEPDWLEQRVLEALQQNRQALPSDDGLVAKAREQLNRVPRDQQLYLRIKQVARYRNLEGFQFASNLGYEVAEVFEGGFFSIPGLYTVKGYTQVFEPELNRLLGEYEEERWILGAAAANPAGEDLSRVRVAVQRAYADDYVRYWQTGLSQLRLVRVQNFDHLLAMLATLTGPSSPMRLTLQAATEHTNYSLSAAGEKMAEQSAVASAIGGVAAKTARNLNKASKALNALDSGEGGPFHLALIRERFKEVHRLTRKDNGQAAAIESLISQLSGLQQYLSPMSLGNQRESIYRASIKRFQSEGADALGQARLTTRQLPEPVRSWLFDLTEQVWSMMLYESQQYIGAAYAEELKTFYDTHLDRRYPFFKDAKQEASFEQFSEFFRPQGVEEKFFQDYLSPFVETGRGRWLTRKVDGQSLALDQETLQQFRRAQRIRSGLFGNKPDFKVKMVIRPLFLDASVSRFELRLDDQRLSYRHGPQRPVHVEWPSDSAAPGVGIAFEDYNGLLAKRSMEGHWSLPRLLENFELQSEQSGGPYQLGYELDGRRVVYSLQGGSDLQVFVQRELQQYRLHDSLGG